MRSKFLVGLSVTGSLCGIAALLSLLYLIPIEVIVSVDKVGYIYEQLSLHMWFLEMILIIVGLAATIVGFVGYQSVKEEAVKQAVEKARQEVIEYLKGVKLEESDTKLRSTDHKMQPDSPEEEV